MVLMKSFIREIKDEIIMSKEKGDCCTLALLYGIILTSGTTTHLKQGMDLEISTSGNQVFDKVNEIVEKLYGGYCELHTDESSTLNHTTYIISIPFEFAKLILEDLQILHNGEFDFNFNENIVENDCCKVSFLKGAFLSTANSSIKFNDGNVNNRGYHLEFVLPNEDLGDAIADILALFSVIERRVYRGNNVIVYLSDYDSILTLIGILGASKSYLKLENENVSRSVNKDVNRQMNFVNANLNKQTEVSAKQILAIKEIDDIIGLSSLPFELFELANARLQNPELSLADLVEKLSNPITKSGINHRMRKLMEINKNLKS